MKRLLRTYQKWLYRPFWSILEVFLDINGQKGNLLWVRKSSSCNFDHDNLLDSFFLLVASLSLRHCLSTFRHLSAKRFSERNGEGPRALWDRRFQVQTTGGATRALDFRRMNEEWIMFSFPWNSDLSARNETTEMKITSKSRPRNDIVLTWEWNQAEVCFAATKKTSTTDETQTANDLPYAAPSSDSTQMPKHRDFGPVGRFLSAP